MWGQAFSLPPAFSRLSSCRGETPGEARRQAESLTPHARQRFHSYVVHPGGERHAQASGERLRGARRAGCVRASGADAFEQDRRWFVVGVLGDEFAFEGFLEDGLAETGDT